MTVPELRYSVAKHMKDNEVIYGDLGEMKANPPAAPTDVSTWATS
jgi:hypothetical protein